MLMRSRKNYFMQPKTIQATRQTNNGFECATGSKWTQTPQILITGVMAVFMATMALQSRKCKLFHFNEDYDSQNPETLEPNIFVVAGTIIQVKSTMCICGALSLICLVVIMGLIEFARGIAGSW